MVVVQFGKGVVTLVTFEGLRLEEGMPIYLQIIRYLERGIAAGTVRDGDELPSRRVLSARLGVNPNTIQKASGAGEAAGVTPSGGGPKSEASPPREGAGPPPPRLLEEEAAALVSALRQMGLDREQAAALVLQLWDRQEESP